MLNTLTLFRHLFFHRELLDDLLHYRIIDFRRGPITVNTILFHDPNISFIVQLVPHDYSSPFSELDCCRFNFGDVKWLPTKIRRLGGGICNDGNDPQSLLQFW